MNAPDSKIGSGTPGPSVLVIEDDESLTRVFTMTLESAGYRVVEAASGQRAIEEVRTRNPDIILLDLGLPDIDGVSLVPQIRKHTMAPILIVSGREQEADKIEALDAGANDYLVKSFSVPELLARIRVGLRGRAHVRDTVSTVVTFGEYRLELEARRLLRGGRAVHLSSAEFNLLAALARHVDQFVTTEVLLKETWGVGYQRKGGYVRVYIHALRHKLEKDPTTPKYLLNEGRRGYTLRASASPSRGDDSPPTTRARSAAA
jgi:two-component system KDP operon response regulator KdpE